MAYPLSPVLGGEGGGEGRFARAALVVPTCASRTPPLTQPLPCVQGRGDGRRQPPGAPDRTDKLPALQRTLLHSTCALLASSPRPPAVYSVSARPSPGGVRASIGTWLHRPLNRNQI